jgi:hypothetical protein
MSTNHHGVDVDYFKKELQFLLDSLANRSSDELARYLQTLAAIVTPQLATYEPYIKLRRHDDDADEACMRPAVKGQWLSFQHVQTEVTL